MSQDNARMQHFATLNHQQQGEAICRLAALGWSEHGIAHATRLSTEMVRRILGERRERLSA